LVNAEEEREGQSTTGARVAGENGLHVDGIIFTIAEIPKIEGSDWYFVCAWVGEIAAENEGIVTLSFISPLPHGFNESTSIRTIFVSIKEGKRLLSVGQSSARNTRSVEVARR
jgi:hypothetical protein